MPKASDVGCLETPAVRASIPEQLPTWPSKSCVHPHALQSCVLDQFVIVENCSFWHTDDPVMQYPPVRQCLRFPAASFSGLAEFPRTAAELSIQLPPLSSNEETDTCQDTYKHKGIALQGLSLDDKGAPATESKRQLSEPVFKVPQSWAVNMNALQKHYRLVHRLERAGITIIERRFMELHAVFNVDDALLVHLLEPDEIYGLRVPSRSVIILHCAADAMLGKAAITRLAELARHSRVVYSSGDDCTLHLLSCLTRATFFVLESNLSAVRSLAFHV